jgi:hypothetical protein
MINIICFLWISSTISKRTKIFDFILEETKRILVLFLKYKNDLFKFEKDRTTLIISNMMTNKCL